MGMKFTSKDTGMKFVKLIGMKFACKVIEMKFANLQERSLQRKTNGAYVRFCCVLKGLTTTII